MENASESHEIETEIHVHKAGVYRGKVTVKDTATNAVIFAASREFPRRTWANVEKALHRMAAEALAGE